MNQCPNCRGSLIGPGGQYPRQHCPDNGHCPWVICPTGTCQATIHPATNRYFGERR